MQEMQETRVQSLGLEDPLEKGMATHSSMHAWRIPWTEESGGLYAMGLQSQTGLNNEHVILLTVTFPGGTSHKESACQCRRLKRLGPDAWVGEIPWNRQMATHSSILAWKIHGQEEPGVISPWGHKDSDTTEHIVHLTLVYYSFPVAFPQLASYILSSLWLKMDLSLSF